MFLSFFVCFDEPLMWAFFCCLWLQRRRKWDTFLPFCFQAFIANRAQPIFCFFYLLFAMVRAAHGRKTLPNYFSLTTLYIFACRLSFVNYHFACVRSWAANSSLKWEKSDKIAVDVDDKLCARNLFDFIHKYFDSVGLNQRQRSWRYCRRRRYRLQRLLLFSHNIMKIF